MKKSGVVDKERFGRRMKSLRGDSEEYGRSMVALANAIEDRYGIRVKASTLYSYEEGRTMPPVDMLMVLAAMLSPGDLQPLLRVALRTDIAKDVFDERQAV